MGSLCRALWWALMLAMTLSALTVKAESWQQYDDNERLTAYYDADAVGRNGSLVLIPVRMVHKKPIKAADDEYDKAFYTIALDCSSRKYAVASYRLSAGPDSSLRPISQQTHARSKWSFADTKPSKTADLFNGLCATPPAREAAAWLNFASSGGGDYYLDLGTLTADGQLRRISELVNLKEPHNGARSGRARREYDCAGKQVRSVSEAMYSEPMAAGDVVETAPPGAGWAAVRDQSAAAMVMTQVCAYVPPSPSARWTSLSETQDAVFYIDTTSISAAGDSSKAWELVDRKKKDAAGQASLRFLSQFDCKGNRFRHVVTISHSEPMAGGSVLRIADRPTEWATVPAGSASMFAFKYVCSRQTSYNAKP